MKPKIAAIIFSATGVCLITMASCPAQEQIVLKGATNGTIGPKGTIEPPLEGVIRGSSTVFGSETPKFNIERPLERRIRGRVSWSENTVAAPAAQTHSYNVAAPNGPAYFYGASVSNPGPKHVVESPLERTIKRSSPLSWSETTSVFAPVKSSAVDVDLPQADSVKPGLVAWQPDFQAACTASVKSSKPVLLFQMMGQLDQEFC